MFVCLFVTGDVVVLSFFHFRYTVEIIIPCHPSFCEGQEELASPAGACAQTCAKKIDE